MTFKEVIIPEPPLVKKPAEFSEKCEKVLTTTKALPRKRKMTLTRPQFNPLNSMHKKLVKITMFLDECIKSLESRYLLETKWISYLIRNADSLICVICSLHRLTDGLGGGLGDLLASSDTQ